MEWVGPHEAEQVVDLTAGWLKAQGRNCASLLRLVRSMCPSSGSDPPLVEPGSGLLERGSVERTHRSQHRLRTVDAIPGADDRHNPPSPTTRERGSHRVASSKTERPRRRRTATACRAENQHVPTHHTLMAYALVKREQGLVMDDIVKALDVN